MSRMVWEFEHSVESGVPRQFAWKYWTDAANWEDPPARFEFDGPFAVGTRIRAILPDQTLWSVIREVKDGQAARIETEVHGAVLAFHWRFEEVAAQRTRMGSDWSCMGRRRRHLWSRRGLWSRACREAWRGWRGIWKGLGRKRTEREIPHCARNDGRDVKLSRAGRRRAAPTNLA